MSPYRDIEDRIRRDREYYQKNREAIIKREREKYVRDHDRIRQRRKELHAGDRKKKANDYMKRRYVIYRKIVIGAYGSQCACCGEKEPLFLEVDHINNDGNIHRKKIGTSGRAIIYWLVVNNFPDGFQLLCSNCNQGKKKNGGICPHIKKDQ
jgi:predicted restriction endonuclease